MTCSRDLRLELPEPLRLRGKSLQVEQDAFLDISNLWSTFQMQVRELAEWYATYALEKQVGDTVTLDCLEC
jgi:hypothetical protein